MIRLMVVVLVALVAAGVTPEVAATPLTGGAETSAQTSPPSGHPFGGPSAPEAQVRPTPAEDRNFFIGLYTDVWQWVRDTQRYIAGQIAKYMGDLAADPSPAAIGFGVLLAFFYGVFHTVGPGHGKTVVISYFLTHPASLWKSAAMGGKIAFTHVISAVVLVGLADVTIRALIGGSPAELEGVQVASYALIALVGVWMLWRTAARIRATRASAHAHAHDHGDDPHHGHHHGHAHGHDHCCHLHHMDEGDAKKDQTLLSIAAGMVPCTGALLIMLFSLANDMILIGVLLVAAISLGMAGAVSIIGAACIFARRLMTSLVAAESPAGGRLAMTLEIAGALAITTIGVLFTLAAYQAGS